MDKSDISQIIGAFVLILIGVVLLGQVSGEGLARTTKTNVVATPVSYTAAFIGTTREINASYVLGPLSALGDTNVDCPLTSYSFVRSNNTAWVETTDYVLNTQTGTFTLLNTLAVNTSLAGAYGNYTNVTYTYCPTGYMNLAWGRTGINLVPGFFALALMAIGIALMYGVFKRHQIA